MSSACRLRPATPADLEAVNNVVERAVASWSLPERVKRLTLPGYRYSAHDLEHLQLVLAEDAAHTVLGVAAWEPADPAEAPPGRRGLLLHGLYVDPRHKGKGAGSRLLAAAVDAAREQGFDGLLVKAQPEATGFFLARDLQPLPVIDSQRDYPHRYWKDVGGER